MSNIVTVVYNIPVLKKLWWETDTDVTWYFVSAKVWWWYLIIAVSLSVTVYQWSLNLLCLISSAKQLIKSKHIKSVCVCVCVCVSEKLHIGFISLRLLFYFILFYVKDSAMKPKKKLWNENFMSQKSINQSLMIPQ